MATYKFKDIAFNSTEKKKPIEEDKYHYIGLEHLDSQCLSVNRYGSEIAPVGDKLIMKKGDVLFGKRRAYQKKVAIAPFDGIFSAHGFVLRPKEKVVDKDFFPFFISSDYFLDKAISISVGSLSPTINWTDLKDVEFELPNLQEQKRLAKILWKLEQVLYNVEKNINAIDQFKRLVFNNIKDFNLVKIVNIANCYQPQNIEASKLNKTGVYKVYGANGVIGYCDEFNSNANTLIIGCRGSCGSVYLINEPSWITSNSMVIDNFEDKVLKKYLFYYFKYTDLSSIITGTAQPQIVRKVLNNFSIKVPSINTQEEIINRLTALENIDKMLLDKINKLKCIKTKIFEEALHV